MANEPPPLAVPDTPRDGGRGGVRSLLRSLLMGASIALLAVALGVLVIVSVLPRVSGWHFVIVAGGSMEPTIPLGSVAVMREIADPSALEVGAIIEYRAPESGTVTTHRIVSVGPDGEWFETQGDANHVADRLLVPAENVIAQYEFHVPFAGRLMEVLQSTAGYLALVLIPGAVLIAYEARLIVRAWRSSSSRWPEHQDRE